MYTFDNGIKLHICQYLDKENCCLSSSLGNVSHCSKDWHMWIKEHFKMKNYKIIHFKPKYKALQWKQTMFCTKCFPLNQREIQEITHIRDSFFHSCSDDSKEYYDSILYKKNQLQQPGYLYVHFNEATELDVFINKINFIFKNIVNTYQLCCEGRGVKILLV
jgi:hypothetical protein